MSPLEEEVIAYSAVVGKHQQCQGVVIILNERTAVAWRGAHSIIDPV